ncbi:MAG: universal stress protein [Candidatus Bathyarchaeota archaeon]
MFEKILVPLDGSEHSVRASDNAVKIAKKFNGKITLIHVYSGMNPVFVSAITRETGIPDPKFLSKLDEAAREAGANILADGEERAKAEGVQVETLLSAGHTVEEILKTSKEGRFDLIVIGARGLSSIKEIFLGSVSHGVIIHARCPVLVVK